MRTNRPSLSSEDEISRNIVRVPEGVLGKIVMEYSIILMCFAYIERMAVGLACSEKKLFALFLSHFKVKKLVRKNKCLTENKVEEKETSNFRSFGE